MTKGEIIRRRIENTKRVRRIAKICAMPMLTAMEYVGFKLLGVPTTWRKAWRETKYELRLESRPFTPPRYDAEYVRAMEILNRNG
jgi:hypothetical protein